MTLKDQLEKMNPEQRVAFEKQVSGLADNILAGKPADNVDETAGMSADQFMAHYRSKGLI